MTELKREARGTGYSSDVSVHDLLVSLGVKREVSRAIARLTGLGRRGWRQRGGD